MNRYFTPKCSTVTETAALLGFNYSKSTLQGRLMSHTYVVMLVHCVFSTKNRRNLIRADLQPRLFRRLYPVAGRASSKAEFPTRICGLFEKARCGIRPEICLGMISFRRFQASLRDAYLEISPPALKRRAIFRLPFQGALRRAALRYHLRCIENKYALG
jgi:hypothetical protein